MVLITICIDVCSTDDTAPDIHEEDVQYIALFMITITIAMTNIITIIMTIRPLKGTDSME
jgi:hypothetical protein